MSAPRRLGPYVIQGLLGEGGMGAVYRARHPELGIERAVKLLSGAAWDPVRAARFEREVRTLAAMEHPNVVAVREAGLEDGRPWFAMDLVEGRPLGRLLSDERLPLQRALAIATDVARGVAALHAAGVIHRDLKPDNVVLAPGDRAVVLDLGLAVAPERDERLTQSGSMLGTLGYMAPEQVSGAKEVTPATDVYALGLILFELVTGASAIPRASSEHELIGRILHQDRARPGSLDPGLPARLDALFARATHRDPARRFPDAGALQLALEQLRQRPGPSLRARRARAILATVTALAACAGAVSLLLTRSPSAAMTTAGGEPTPGEPAGAVQEERRARDAARQLDALKELTDPGARLERTRAWLLANGGHARAAEARALVASDQREAPLLRLRHEGDARGWFLGSERALTLGSDGAVRAWSLRDGAELGAWPCHGSPTTLAPAPDGERFVVARRPHTLELLSPGRDAPLASLPHPWEEILCLRFTPDGAAVIAGGKSGWVHLIDATTGAELNAYGMHLGHVVDLALARGGKMLITLSAVTRDGVHTLDNQVRVFDVATQRYVVAFPLTAPPTCVAISPDGRHYAVGDARGEVLLIDLPRGEVVTALAPAEPCGGVVALAYSPDGATLYAAMGGLGAAGASLRAWAPEEERQVAERPLGAAPTSLALDAAGRHLLVGTRSGRVELWALEALVR